MYSMTFGCDDTVLSVLGIQHGQGMVFWAARKLND